MSQFIRNKLKLLVIVIGIFILIPACSQQNTPVATSQHKIVAKDFAPGELKSHFLKHKQEFDYSTKEEYLNGARRFLNSSKSKEILEKIRPNGDILHYHIRTGEFAVMTKDGRIKTYFKANYQYWMRQ